MLPAFNEKMSVFPIMNMDDNLNIKEEDFPKILPLLTLRNAVLFPATLIPITVGREKSIHLVREAYEGNKLIGAVSQLDARTEDPGEKDLFPYGCLALILKIIEMPNNGITIILQGLKRFKIDRIVQTTPYFAAEVDYLNEYLNNPKDTKFRTVLKGIKDAAAQIIASSPHIPKEAEFAIKNIENPGFLINFVASNINLEDTDDKLQLLKEDDLAARANLLLEKLYKELELSKIKDRIQQKVKGEIDQQQKEYYLSNQLKTIQDELGISSDMEEIEELRAKGAANKWNAETAAIFEKELNKLERSNPHNPDYNIQLNYLQFMADLPWGTESKDNLNLKRARSILNRDHYALEAVKERILEHLSVLKLKGDLKSPILCLYGPPGVGKTSLGHSVADALNRRFARISLGGMHDESEIRGHRRTYIGAMPGRILESIKRCGTCNPVIVLDEIDKVGSDFRGDPSSALLEVLDPDQNNTFHDNYLDVDFDLSKVLFITTANTINPIPPALRDRMELIPISGYLAEEKRHIAIKHLIPKQLEAHGLKSDQIVFTKNSIDTIINEYTRESGVRILDRSIAKIVRHTAKSIAFGEKYEKTLTPQKVREILGNQRIIQDVQKGNEFPGVVTGLAWTETGGEILFIETSLSKGKGVLSTTGNLGDVMKESAIIALQYIKAHPQLIGVQPDIFEQTDVHIHVPEGAIPKDGPSAGIAMLCSLASAFKKQTIKHGIAMTGEITLRGRILPVGGIKEKILAAKRSGIKTIVLSEENKQDIDDIKPMYIKGLNFHYIRTIEDAFAFVF